MTTRLTLFAHIPKTAGTSLNNAASGNYDSVFHFGKEAAGQGTQLVPWVEGFRQASASISEAGEKTVYVHGHFGFGFHDYVGHPASYITFLRDPVERVVSHYYYLTRPGSGTRWSQDPPSLSALLRQRRLPAFDNLQTRHLSGLGWYRPRRSGGVAVPELQLEYGECSREVLELAKDNIAHRILFGLQDRYDESLAFLRSALGWQGGQTADGLQNVNPHRRPVAELDEELISFIRGENVLDIELYEFASSIFDSQIAKRGPVVVDPVAPKTNLSNAVPERKQPLPPEFRDAHQEARQLFDDGEFGKAAAKLASYVTAETEHVPSLNILARCCERLGKVDEARAIYRRIVALGPANVDKFLDRLEALEPK